MAHYWFVGWPPRTRKNLTMTETSKLTRTEVIKAITSFRKEGRRKFLRRGGFGDKSRWMIRLNNRFYPSKAIVGRATGRSSRQFSGGVAHLGRALRALGFRLVNLAKKVALIACSAAKCDRTTTAADLYRGDFFNKAVAYARHALQGAFAILSAKHGLLDPEDIVAPYDQRLGGAAARREWAVDVHDALYEQFGEETTFVLLCGKDYAAAAEGFDVESPLAGLGLGDKKGWLRRAVAA